MLNVTQLLTEEVARRIDSAFDAMFGDAERDHMQIAKDAAAAALGHIAKSDALYHNVEHTVHVTIVGLEILKAKHSREPSGTPGHSAHTADALVMPDIRYACGSV